MRPGEILAVIGPNGAGKSTLLKVLCGDIGAATGEVRMNGRPLRDWSLRERAKARAVLPQETALGFLLPVFEVVLMGRSPHLRGGESAHDRAIAREALRLVEADHLARRGYTTLSGGERQRVQLARVTDDERDQLLNDWGGTTTSDRRDWMAMIDEGVQQGWYKIRFGHVERVERDEKTGKLDTVIRGRTSLEGHTALLADFVIDSTGFVANLENNPLLKDLVAHYNLPRNVKDRLNVTTNFEIPDMQNGRGRVFASGATTLGSAFAPVDSFLGMQYAALRAADFLAQHDTPGLRPLNLWRSIGQWLRWARGVAP